MVTATANMTREPGHPAQCCQTLHMGHSKGKSSRQHIGCLTCQLAVVFLDLCSSCQRQTGDRRPALRGRRTCTWGLLSDQALRAEEGDAVLEEGDHQGTRKFDVVPIHTNLSPFLLIHHIFLFFFLWLDDGRDENGWGSYISCARMARTSRVHQRGAIAGEVA